MNMFTRSPIEDNMQYTLDHLGIALQEMLGNITAVQAKEQELDLKQKHNISITNRSAAAILKED